MTSASSRTSIAIAPADRGALVQVSDRVLAVASAVNDDADRERFKTLLRRHPEFLVRSLSSHYPLDSELIALLTEHWEQDIMYAVWDYDREDVYESYWKIWRDGLSCNVNIPWTQDLIERYAHCWKWDVLSANRTVPWTSALVERYAEDCDWNALSENPAIPWSLDFIERFADRWDWGSLSENPGLPWSLDFIERFADRWDWVGLSGNPGLPWSLDFIERFADRLMWGWRDYCRGVYDDEILPVSQADQAEFESVVRSQNWVSLSRNPALPWGGELLERFAERWDWDDLSVNPGLPWTLDLIDLFAGRGFSRCLSVNPALPWSLSLIERFADQWDWEDLSTNPALPWSQWLIERFADRWDWGQFHMSHTKGLSANVGLPWSLDLIERFEDRLDFTWLSLQELPMWRLLRRQDVVELVRQKFETFDGGSAIGVGVF